MKTLIMGLLATTLVAAPLATAASAQARPDRDRDRDRAVTVQQRGDGRTVVNQRTAVRAPQYRTSWRKGERFDQRQARNYRQIDYRQYRGLRAPPRGYRYVQSGNDAVLVGITSGLIASVFAGAIR